MAGRRNCGPREGSACPIKQIQNWGPSLFKGKKKTGAQAQQKAQIKPKNPKTDNTVVSVFVCVFCGLICTDFCVFCVMNCVFLCGDLCFLGRFCGTTWRFLWFLCGSFVVAFVLLLWCRGCAVLCGMTCVLCDVFCGRACAVFVV